jgi:hypothetical protein
VLVGSQKGVFGAQFTKFITVLATLIFNVHIACPSNHSGIFIQNLPQELIAPDLQCAIMCQWGGVRGVNLSCHPYEMGVLRQVFVLHVPFDTLPGVPHMIGISHTDIMDSVWHVVEAVNNYPQFQITYPSSVGEQEKIVAGFEKVSSVGFNVCGGGC